MPSLSPPPPAVAAAEQTRHQWPVVRWLWSSLPTAVVVAALASIAVWGHSTDWTLPKFSTLVGGEPAAVEDWCVEHNVPESECIECRPNLLPPGKDYGWCREHGIAQCPFEHPDVAQTKVAPSLSNQELERASRALALRPRPENNSNCKLHNKRIQFASTAALEKVGVDIAIVQQRPILETVMANGEVIYDETHAAHLASRVAGNVWRVEKQVGERVEKGEVLALIDAAEVGEAKAEFVQTIARLRLAMTNMERLKPLGEEGIVAGKQLREAETALQEAKIDLARAQQKLLNLGFAVDAAEFADVSPEEITQRIQFLGLPYATVASLGNESRTSNLFPLRSPLSGVVVERKVVPGEVVDTNNTIFGIADVTQMWLMLDVRQDDAKYLSLAQTVLFRPSDSQNEPAIEGSLAWISTAADDQTRTVKVRVNLPNENGRLRANIFGTGRIVLRDEPQAVVVPSEAVHWDGCCNVVFVRDKNFFNDGVPKFFHIRKVRLGVKEGDMTEIIAGLVPGEVIASKNSVVLEAQLLKSNLGAGCGCTDGH
jgi:cobalt-zinc-cadmium efflux system membrane fusion protein